ncbi:UvrD-helicase domain-containing protein [Gordonia sp. 852002-51296_SCH5728562-b]|uniref:UvrD-helicase domain-containing protein n=1 Tax=Gordonia sp. 852002-51296_SCH5728562-b TaxID=1834101 RepID=UPI0007E94657|nr:UvrD-helicase domain-containing protein [Gordonia sp. 852002-51296_SCH5728562-b]OBA42046.1 hypothetical protein A5766_19920 [Gordonia sp. 852002-51296_SCH5728562-b]
MTEFEPTAEQRRVIECTQPLLVVLGGAGTGKTTTACAAARAHLERQNVTDRVLFLSFSRASVGRVLQRARGVVGPWGSQIDVTTFHALAWSIVRRFGAVVGHENPVLRPPAYQRLLEDPEALGYDDLIPLALKVLEESAAVRRHVERRWGLVIVDEYQDTGDLQTELIDSVSTGSRRMLLGDPNQCIYASFLSGAGVRAERIEDAADEAGAEGVVHLPPASHRDKTGLIPAIAQAIMRREFEHEAIHEGLRSGRMVVESSITAADEGTSVARWVQALTAENLSVGVYCHHNDMLAELSDRLQEQEIDHDIAGMSDALSLALLAHVEMCKYAAGASEWDEVLQSVAVFVASAQKGSQVPPLAWKIMREVDGSLGRRLSDLRRALEEATLADATGIAADAHSRIGLPAKSRAWSQATTILRPMIARAKRARDSQSAVLALAREAEQAASGLLTDVVDDPGDVQLMNLHQTKGREADATIVVLRATDFFGKYEKPPYENTSRLLYVVFSRARHRVVLLLVGQGLPAQVAPLASLASLTGT